MLDLDLPRAVPQRLRDRAAIEAHAAVAACTALDVNRLPPHALAALLAASASLTMRIAARMALSATTEPENTPRTAPRAEQFISVRAAATRLATEPKWLYRRQEHLPFMRQLSPGRWRVSVTALETWMRARRRPLTVP